MMGKRALIALAGWFVPGLGHLITGRPWRALIYAATFAGLFYMGIILHGGMLWIRGDIVSYFAYLGRLGGGVPAFVALYLPATRLGEAMASTFELGSTYLTVAGGLNLLAALSLFDIVPRKTAKGPEKTAGRAAR